MPELTCKQVNGRIAKAIGWTCRKVEVMHGGFDEADGPVTEEDVWFRPDGEMSVSYKCPDYCHDLNACAEAERMIAKRGLALEYMQKLIGLVDIPQTCSRDAFELVTAPPETRARALVKVLEENGDAK